MLLRSLLEILLLGVVQGLTEFIPVSSSAHLVLVPYLLGLEEHELAFDVALHVGTFGAVLAYFRAELTAMLRGFLGMDHTPDGLLYRRLGLFLAAATLPLAVVGATLQSLVAGVSESPLTTSCLLFVTAALLVTGERIRDRRTRHRPVQMAAVSRATGGQRQWADVAPAAGDEPQGQQPTVGDGPQARLPVGADPSDPSGVTLGAMSLRQALLIGTAQCFALFPGVSRSGTTIVSGMAVGMTREAATRFSFLLALPALVGATVLTADDLVSAERTFTTLELVVGVASAFVSGYLAIRFLVALVARDRLTGFAWYCAAAGTVGLIGVLLRG